jgi:N6-adenosine-specific RNA methylase IME4
MEDFDAFRVHASRAIDAVEGLVDAASQRADVVAAVRARAAQVFATQGRLYNIIVADPPWRYDNAGISGGTDAHYNSMADEDIWTLPVQGLAADDCALLMWATFPKLDIGMRTIKMWGFSYYREFTTWIKINRHKGTPVTGIGRVTRSNAEVLLLGVRGQIVQRRLQEETVGSVTLHRRGGHSEKPRSVLRDIERVWGNLPRIELFSRQRQVGWDAWGNEVTPSIAAFMQPSDARVQLRDEQDARAAEISAPGAR